MSKNYRLIHVHDIGEVANFDNEHVAILSPETNTAQFCEENEVILRQEITIEDDCVSFPTDRLLQ